MQYSPVFNTRRGVPFIRLPRILKGSELKNLLSFTNRHGIKKFAFNAIIQTELKLERKAKFSESSFPVGYDVVWNIPAKHNLS